MRVPDAVTRSQAIEAATRAIEAWHDGAQASDVHHEDYEYEAYVARIAVDAALVVVGPRIAAAERDQIRAAVEQLPEYAYTRADKPGVLFRGLNRGAVLAVVAAHPVLGLLGGVGNNQ